MSALDPRRRKITAREAAEQVGCTPRHIRSVVAEPRHEFLARAAERQRKAADWKDEGLTYREIAERLDCTPKAAENLVLRGRKARKVTA
uniref:DNA-binding protein RepB n=1 Tax=Arthrobacter rhombi TaxID=71253 RepID=G8DC57_9MICC|nr:sigma factor-like helix-turn-helix DNA-binding protein [Arthrobacter rhombi]AER68057.1 DNA-binding protein RepB [Arthrobacter rhombi]AER68062.1 DNA-binding protein RepB [Shuttle vector pRMU824]AER68067.1 DNA-binding protein RepB [Shuttle vector pRMU824Km]AER68072.1 DNA-binding protein RepB [Shuttle vector pRMU824Tc]